MQSCVAVTSLTAGLQHALKYEFLPAQDPAMHLARRSPRLGFGGIARSRKGGSGGRAPPRGGILRGGGSARYASAQLSSAQPCTVGAAGGRLACSVAWVTHPRPACVLVESGSPTPWTPSRRRQDRQWLGFGFAKQRAFGKHTLRARPPCPPPRASP